MNKHSTTRWFISSIIFIILLSSTPLHITTQGKTSSIPIYNTVKVNLAQGLVHSTYSSQVLGLQEINGSQWVEMVLINEKDETGKLIQSPQIQIQTPLSWSDILAITPTNETIDAMTKRIYTWNQDHLIQGKNIEAKIWPSQDTEFMLPFYSSRSFSHEIITNKYTLGTLTVNVIPYFDAQPNSILTITIETGMTSEIVSELLEHTFFIQGAQIQQINPIKGNDNFQLQLKKWGKGQEIKIHVQMRVRNRLYNPESGINSIRYVPGVQISYTERNTRTLHKIGQEANIIAEGIGNVSFSANGEFHWKIEDPPSQTTRMVRYQLISAPTNNFIEIEINKFYLKEDKDPGASIGQVYFEINSDNFDYSFRAPKYGYEDTIYKTYTPRPGPIFIPNNTLTLPINISIEAYERDGYTSEKLVRYPLKIIIDSWEELYSGHPHIFDQRDIYFEVIIRPVMKFANPYSNYQNLEEYQIPKMLPNDIFLQDQWYWFEVGSDKIWTSYELSDFADVTIAVIDTGVDYTHPDLYNKMLRDSHGQIIGWNTIENNNNTMDDHPSGHGTMMAGIITAEVNNSQYFAGIAPNAKIMPIKVVSNNRAARASDFAEGINFAIINGADIISVSIGSYFTSNIVQTAISSAYDHGIYVITAVGNERTTKPTIPASYQETLVVTGVQRYNNYLVFADKFSNYGPDLLSTTRSPWVTAPAVDIMTTNTTKYGNGIGIDSGTSYATPIVSAAIALILGYANQSGIELSPDLIRWLLQTSTTDLGAVGWDPYYGYGLINVYRAINLMKSLGNVTTSPEKTTYDTNLPPIPDFRNNLDSNNKIAQSAEVITRRINPIEKSQRNYFV